MTDYSENYLKLQRLMKAYHNATLKFDYDKAMQYATKLSEETIKLEIATLSKLKQSWLS
jgi:hypothetical protein